MAETKEQLKIKEQERGDIDHQLRLKDQVIAEQADELARTVEALQDAQRELTEARDRADQRVQEEKGEQLTATT